MKKPLYYEREGNPDDYARIDNNDGRRFRVCRTGEKPRFFTFKGEAIEYLESLGYRHTPRIVAMY